MGRVEPKRGDGGCFDSRRQLGRLRGGFSLRFAGGQDTACCGAGAMAWGTTHIASRAPR
ncbi:hypothetical protein ABTC48_19815 [Acinetobacter baumannii]